MRHGKFLATAFGLALFGAASVYAGAATAQPAAGMMGPGMMGGYGPMMSPWGMGGGMMGPGMMGGYGGGMMGPGMMGGMMGPGMMGPGMMGQGMMGWRNQQANLNLSANDVKSYFQGWIAFSGNPHIKVGNVTEKNADTITADIVTTDKDGLVQRYEVDRHTGLMRPAAG